MAEEKTEGALLRVLPDAWDAVLGHEKPRARLVRLLREGRVPHALLFSGPQGVGKKKTALALAAALLCSAPKDGLACGTCKSCKALAAGTHPDLYAVLPEQAGKATPSVKIEQIRAMRGEASRAPLLSGRRVVLIDDAETMNDAASNALLKTLEEPVGATTFLLITGARQAVLPTIVSRCTGVMFGPLDTESIARILEAHGVTEEARGALAALSDGSAGHALRLFAEDALPLRDDAMTALESLPRLSVEAVFALGARLGALERGRLLEWFRYLRLFLRDLLAIYGGSSTLWNGDFETRLFALSGALSEAQAFLIAKEATEAARRLRTSNASPRLVVEGFLLKAKQNE